MDDATIVNEYPNGVVKKFKTENGKVFEAYIPNNYTSSTNVIIYEHGDGGYSNDWKTYKDKFETGECDSIIIRADRNKSSDLYNHIVSEYNLTGENKMTVSFSGGTSYAFAETKKIIEQNPDAAAPVTVIMDGYIPYQYLGTNGTSAAIREANGIILAFGRPNDSGYYKIYQQYAKESKTNMIIFKDTSSYGKSHMGVNNSFMEAGLLEYVEGRGELPDRYEICIYDSEKGEFVTLDRSQVSTLADVYSLFGLDYKGKPIIRNYTLTELGQIEDLSVTSDSGVLEESLNKIRSVIRNSNIVNCGSLGGCSSTTMMPSQIGAVVSRFLESTTSCLSKIVNETSQFAAIGESIEELNFNLERQAMEINDIELVESVYGPVVSVSEEEVKQEYLTVETVQESSNTVEEETVVVPSNKGTVSSVDTNYEVKSNTVVDSSNNGSTPTIVVPTNKVDNGSSGKQNNGSSVAGALISSSTVISNNIDNNKDVVIDNDEFVDYDTLLSNDTQLVYEYDNGCKLVIYKDGDTIIGVEHYFDLSKCNMSTLDIKHKYVDNEFFSELVEEDNLVKVVLKSSMYENRTVTDIKNILDSNKGYKLV